MAIGNNNPLVNVSPRSFLAQQLLQQAGTDEPVQSWTQGLNRLAQALVGAAMMRRISGENAQAMQAFSSGVSAQPWLNPDTGTAQARASNSPGAPLTDVGPAGGYAGALAALGRIAPGNEAAAAMMPGIASAKLASDTESALAQYKMAAELAQTEARNKTTLESARIGAESRERAAAASAAARRYAADKTAGGLSGGPFAGTSMDAQIMNVLLQGDPASDVYRAAYNEAAKARTIFDPASGNMVQVSPDMSAYRLPVGVDGGQEQSAPAGVTIKNIAQPKLSTADRGKVADLDQALREIGEVRGFFLDANGQMIPGRDQDVLAAQKFGPIEGVPFTEGRGLRQKATRAIEVLLRARTGAAAPESEVSRYASLYFPSVGDTPAQIANKMDSLEQLLQETRRNIVSGRVPAEPSPARAAPASPARPAQTGGFKVRRIIEDD